MKFSEFRDKVRKMPYFSSDVADLFPVQAGTMRNQLSRWKKRGLLLELKRGLYCLGHGERQTELSRETAAAAICQPSYISLETALSVYKLIPERVRAVTSVTTKKTCLFRNEIGEFIYRHVKTPLYFGFVAQKDEQGYPFFIAEPEKALLDYLYLNLGGIAPDDPDYFSGSLRLQNRRSLDQRKLKAYAGRFQNKKLAGLVERLR